MENLRLRPDTLSLQTAFSVAGISCAAATNSEEIIAQFRRWPAATSARDPSLRISVLELSRPDDVSDEMHFRGLQHLVFAALGPGNRFLLDLRRRHAAGVVSPHAARNSGFWQHIFLPIVIGTLGVTVGLVPLHCACLDLAGEGLLIAGTAGAGKSTLAVALLNHGFSFLSDEWTYALAKDGQLTLHSLGGPAKLLPDAARFFPELRQQRLRTAMNGELSYEVDVSSWSGVPPKACSFPRRLFFLQRADTSGCRFVACDPGFTVSFFEQSMERLPEELQDVCAQRSEIIRQLSATKSWVLETGESPQGTARALAAFCARAPQ
jgi:hypothetical protein